jgi:hypothetical protein
VNNMAETIDITPKKETILSKIKKINESMPKVKKEGTNPHFKSKYMTLDSVLELSAQIQKEHNLSIIQYVDNMVLETRIADLESQEYFTSKTPLILGRQDMQALGSAISYARRYSLVTMLGIAEADDDGNSTNAGIDPFSTNTKAVK